MKQANEDNIIRWHEDGMKFETIRESHEWAYSVVFNEIGNLYDGYITNDEKIAYSLVYELIRVNTLHGERFQIFSDYGKVKNKFVYKVWVKTIK
ncbi:hypothetical protein ACFVR2_22845 [Gottfriedia sp. NPDC057991]|uniref:hypothetical protein n=1 Tax=Gottfriedia sp. NPDC057991 TaxID=3346298 RepID=UPI0036DEC070